MTLEDAFYIIGNLPIPLDDPNYDICQYQEAKAIALDCIDTCCNEKQSLKLVNLCADGKCEECNFKNAKANVK